MSSEENKRLIREVVLQGTHLGDFQSIHATGKPVEVRFDRLDQGRIVERWGVVDMMNLMAQLGAMAN